MTSYTAQRLRLLALLLLSLIYVLAALAFLVAYAWREAGLELWR